MPIIRIIGPGRAGTSLARALAEAGWTVLPPLGRGDDLTAAASGTDVLVLAVPDDALADVAAAVRPVPATVVVHLAGSLGPDVLAPHPRRAALHPLVALPDAETGAERLRSGITFAVAGDPAASDIATTLGGTAVEVPDDARATYHAAASVAANHVVALLGQVERIAGAIGLPLEAFLPLARAAVDDAGRVGPRRALTGPAARGDWQTLARHLDAIPAAERAAYRAGVGLALHLTVGAGHGSAPGTAGTSGTAERQGVEPPDHEPAGGISPAVPAVRAART
ncbi:MAG TPA: DUF2520 domain-containing protein [Acidimicrobiales bacterium]|nr:DUF2520 domain-containing protein [Acidimicrobiales bacterium]